MKAKMSQSTPQGRAWLAKNKELALWLHMPQEHLAPFDHQQSFQRQYH